MTSEFLIRSAEKPGKCAAFLDFHEEELFGRVSLCQLKICVHIPDAIPDTPVVITSLLKSLLSGKKRKQLFRQAKQSKVAQHCQTTKLYSHKVIDGTCK